MFSTRSLIQAGLTALVLAACAKEAETPAAPPNDPAAVRSAIEAANAKGAAAMKAGDTTAWSHYADDAVVLMANYPAWRGRAEWSAGYKGLMAAMTVKEAAFRTTDVVVEGDVAIETGEYSMTLVVKPSGPEIKDDGKYLTIWKKQADGSWKVIRDAGNTSMPAPK